MSASYQRYRAVQRLLKPLLTSRSFRIAAAALVLAVCGLVAAGRSPTSVSATGSGPEFLVGGPSLSGGQVQVPVYAWLAATDPYIGFTIHLRWDPAVFSFASANATGGVFDPNASPSTGFCVSDSTTFDSDGGGVVFGCSGYAATQTSYHLLATISLTPVAAGCSTLHLYTYGGTDGGDSSSGTFTVNAADNTPQSNGYRDGTADNLGQSCTPPQLPSSPSGGTPSPAPQVPGVGVNCKLDMDGNGRINILDLSFIAGVMNKTVVDSGWLPHGPLADVNADSLVNILDLSAVASGYNQLVSYCQDVAGYPFYNPGPAWTGALPNGYDWSEYLIFTGALVYQSGKYDCSALFPSISGWAFKSPTTQTFLSACDATGKLAALSDAIELWDFNNHIGWINQVFVGPNDCTYFITNNPDGSSTGQSIADGAQAFHTVISIASAYAAEHDPNVFYEDAVVDDEGYTGPSCDAATASGAQFPNADALFAAYFSGGLPAMGPAGTAHGSYSPSQEQTLATSGGGGLAIPQVYNDNNAQLDWPTTMDPGYVAIQTYPTGGFQWTDPTAAEYDWYLYHGPQHPPVDFIWPCPLYPNC